MDRNNAKRNASKARAYTEYLRNLRKIEIEMKRIQDGIEAMKKEDDINWGHAGDAAHLQDQLTEIADRLSSTGEYA